MRGVESRLVAHSNNIIAEPGVNRRIPVDGPHGDTVVTGAGVDGSCPDMRIDDGERVIALAQRYRDVAEIRKEDIRFQSQAADSTQRLVVLDIVVGGVERSFPAEVPTGLIAQAKTTLIHVVQESVRHKSTAAIGNVDNLAATMDSAGGEEHLSPVLEARVVFVCRVCNNDGNVRLALDGDIYGNKVVIVIGDGLSGLDCFVAEVQLDIIVVVEGLDGKCDLDDHLADICGQLAFNRSDVV